MVDKKRGLVDTIKFYLFQFDLLSGMYVLQTWEKYVYGDFPYFILFLRTTNNLFFLLFFYIPAVFLLLVFLGIIYSILRIIFWAVSLVF